MSKTLQKYFLKEILFEFFFFFALFESLSFMISSLRYSLGKGIFNAEIILFFSFYISPFMLVFSYNFSLFVFFRETKDKVKFLQTFGGALEREKIFFMLLSLLFFSIDLFFAFYISPKSFRKIEKISALYLISPEKFDGKKAVLWDEYLLVADEIQRTKDGSIKAENGFIFFNEKNIMKFKEIEIKPKYGYKRFSKDISDLIIDEGDKGKKEVIYLSSFAFSSVSCSSLFISGFLKAGAICPAVMLGISKLARDNMKINQSIIFLLSVHLVLLSFGLFYSSSKKFLL